ncbi:MAG: flagellar basal body L-ring protein FlgH [bacterium]
MKIKFALPFNMSLLSPRRLSPQSLRGKRESGTIAVHHHDLPLPSGEGDGAKGKRSFALGSSTLGSSTPGSSALGLFASGLFALGIVCGCVGSSQNLNHRPPFALQPESLQSAPLSPGVQGAHAAADEAPPLVSDGSIWNDASASGYLFADPKARSVGDIVTVNIVENASAKGNASTKTGKKYSASAGIPSLLGIEKSVASHNPDLDPSSLLSASTSNSFDGSGEISRSGKITATISGRVIRVLPNGDLVIRGTRQVIINNEQQLITIQGIIRPEDLSPDNTIPSTSIADAQIAYTGKGIVSDKQHPGWLSRVMDIVWPF